MRTNPEKLLGIDPHFKEALRIQSIMRVNPSNLTAKTGNRSCQAGRKRCNTRRLSAYKLNQEPAGKPPPSA